MPQQDLPHRPSRVLTYLGGSRIAVSLAVVLLAFVSVVWIAGSGKSDTVDEGLFIIGGAVQARYGEPNIDLTHPPLLRWVAGVPAVLLGRAATPPPVPLVPRGEMDLQRYFQSMSEMFNYTRSALYAPGSDHRRTLFWGRAGFALIGALLCAMVFVTVRRFADPWVALVAAAVAATVPEILAHSQWAHSDLASAVTFVMVALALARAIDTPTRGSAALLGGALGLAISTKLTALLIAPIALLAIALPGRDGGRGRVLRIVVFCAVTWCIIVAAYWPNPRLFPHSFLRADLEVIGWPQLGPILQWIPLPDTFLKGVLFTKILSGSGHVAFFRGEVSYDGWRMYFPAALVLKYPTGLLAAALVGLGTMGRTTLSRGMKFALVAVPTTLFVAAMMQRVNIGVRSILPVAPFLVIWAAVALHTVRRPALRVALMAALATSFVSGIRAYPDFLAWFNPLAGGTAAASEWFVDSNYDWGQDLPALERELRTRKVREVRLAYLGSGVPSRYGIRSTDAGVRDTGWYAISRSYLTGWWPPGDPYGWLRGLQPVALVGGSIALFHVFPEDLLKHAPPPPTRLAPRRRE